MTSKQAVGCLKGLGISLGLNLKASLSTESFKQKIIHVHVLARNHTCTRFQLEGPLLQHPQKMKCTSMLTETEQPFRRKKKSLPV